MPADTIGWTVQVFRDTGIALRSFLAQRGLQKGGRLKFIADAVKWHVFEQTMAEIRDKFADLPLAAPVALIDEVVTATRRTRAG